MNGEEEFLRARTPTDDEVLLVAIYAEAKQRAVAPGNR